jgi:hypothetical protein
MSFEKILQPIVQEYIQQHENDDEHALVLRVKEIAGVPVAEIADQIRGRRTAKDKLPLFYNTTGIVYPPRLNLEQCSSQNTALFKANVIRAEVSSTDIVADLTGGFGVDAFFLSEVCRQMHYAEPDESLFNIVVHNHKALGAVHITHHCTTAEQFVETLEKADVLYIDPSRRNSGQKVFRLKDCLPDVTTLQKTFFEKTRYVLVKTSPLLDIQQGLGELTNVKKVYVVSVANECKELLFLCERAYSGTPEIVAVNILSHRTDEFSFTILQEQAETSAFGNPQTYLYEPNASLLKAGAFKITGNVFNLKKLHIHTHLYTSDQLIADFPGRVFQVEALIKNDRKIVQAYFPQNKANVVTRNYPLKAEELKKKVGLQDGGDKFLIGFSGQQEKYLAVASRIL